mmetsp:Transcript_13795/g.39717  ORF Transcript_13795/g.39717 Transcript_13795/m.39717 type:complete len:207 (+) Transcript_13795:320-940(+)
MAREGLRCNPERPGQSAGGLRHRHAPQVRVGRAGRAGPGYAKAGEGVLDVLYREAAVGHCQEQVGQRLPLGGPKQEGEPQAPRRLRQQRRPVLRGRGLQAAAAAGRRWRQETGARGRLHGQAGALRGCRGAAPGEQERAGAGGPPDPSRRARPHGARARRAGGGAAAKAGAGTQAHGDGAQGERGAGETAQGEDRQRLPHGRGRRR